MPQELTPMPHSMAGRALFHQGCFSLRKAASVPQFPHLLLQAVTLLLTFLKQAWIRNICISQD